MNGHAATSGLSNRSSSRNMDLSAVDASGLLQTLQGHVDEIRSLIQCGICVRPLYEPYTLACGHTFCYGCLTSWFSSGRSSKTCPDCRALVKALPAPAYLVRAIVQMFTSRAELLEKGETTAQHKENRQEEAEKLEADKTNTHPRTGGLFQGSFKERPPVHRPIYDVEDNVNRCPICQWELEDTGCHHCGYGLDVETLTDSEENSEMTDYIDDLEDGFGDLDEDLVWNDIYHGVPFDELPFGLQQFHGGRPRMPHHHHHHHHHPLLPEAYATLIAPSISTASRDDSGSEDEDEEEDDFGEMDSFIDDDEVDDDESDSDRSTVVGDHDYTAHPLDDFEDEGSDVPMSQDAEDVDDYYDEDSSEDEDPIRPPVTGNSRRTVQSGSARPISGSRLRRRSSLRDAGVDTNGSSRFFREDTADRNTRPEQQQQRASRPASVGLSVDNAIPVDDDSDDDDAPVRPTRRNRRTATRNNQQLDIY